MKQSSPLFDRVVLVGIGLIGSSMAQAIRINGLAGWIGCVDSNPLHVEQALELKLVDAASLSPDTIIPDADLVVLCVPVGAMGNVVRAITPFLKKGCILSDVGSVKGAVIADLMPLLPEDVSFVPAHPIAGTEESGPAAGFPELFQSRWCLVTPSSNASPESIDKLSALWTGLGARVGRVSPEEHDRILAAISHLPQMVSYVVAATAGAADDRGPVFRYSAGGFRDVTRIAASNPAMWRDIFLGNQQATLEIVDQFAANLDLLRQALRTGDSKMLEKFFANAQKAKLKSLEQVGTK